MFHFIKCIIHRSLYPDESLPEFDEAIERYDDNKMIILHDW